MATVLSEERPQASEQAAHLYESYSPQIYRFCLARLRSREEAEDLILGENLRRIYGV